MKLGDPGRGLGEGLVDLALERGLELVVVGDDPGRWAREDPPVEASRPLGNVEHLRLDVKLQEASGRFSRRRPQEGHRDGRSHETQRDQGDAEHGERNRP
jgi:hypothetical protein